MAESKVPQPKTEDQRRPSIPQRIESHIQGRTLAGLFELVPLLATIFVISFIIGYADGLIRPLPFVAERPWDFTGVGLVALIVIFYLVGLLVSTRFGRRLIELKGVVLGHIPIVKTIFGVTQQAMTSMTSQYNFSRVVFVEWPREGMIAMGFVTGQAVSTDTGESMAVVYIPTVPNPTSGNMAFVIEDDLMETDLTVEGAMKLVFSGGIVLPEGISFARIPREQREGELLGRFESRSG